VLRILACAFTVLTLLGCGRPGYEAQLQNYLERLARPLGAKADAPGAGQTPSPPRAESLQLTVDGAKLDGLDFLRLRGCALQTTIARRNSSLGRIAPPSQRLLLELAFLRDAPECIRHLESEGSEQLALLLRESATLKRAQLPALIFNATLGTREYRDFWRAASSLGDYPTQTSSLVVTALEQINEDAARWLSGDYAADERRFELALSEIARGDGGELLTALLRQSAYLSSANQLIDEKLKRGALCTKGRVPAAAPILRTVTQKFFITEVQATAAKLNQRYHALLNPIEQLENLLDPVFPSDYQVWRSARNDALTKGSEAPARHVYQLQSLLGSCFAEFAPRKNRDNG
jgi:hypothetical protein